MKNIKTLVTNEPFNKQFRRCIILMFESALFMKFAVYMQATFHRREWIWDLNKKSFRLDGLLDIARSPLIFFAQIISPIFILEMESRPCGRRGISLKLEKWNKVMQCWFEEKYENIYVDEILRRWCIAGIKRKADTFTPFNFQQCNNREFQSC